MTFTERLNILGFRSYEEYLDSALWQKFKDSYRLAGRSLECAVCRSSVIQLHHTTYERLGCESLDDVMPLCRDHHTQVHAYLKTNRLNVGCSEKAVSLLKIGMRFDATLVTGKIPKKTKADKIAKKAKRAAKKAALAVGKATRQLEQCRSLFAKLPSMPVFADAVEWMHEGTPSSVLRAKLAAIAKASSRKAKIEACPSTQHFKEKRAEEKRQAEKALQEYRKRKTADMMLRRPKADTTPQGSQNYNRR